MNEHGRLRELLDQAFTAVAEREGRGPFRDKEMAQRLGISSSQLSYLLRGERRLTRDVAARFGERLYPESSSKRDDFLADLAVLHDAPHTLREFEDRLLSVARPSELDPRKAAEALFSLIGGNGWFLCVEYRDLPRATEAYPVLADAAGKAVAAGLCFAMIQPFGTDFSKPPPGEPAPSKWVLLFLNRLALMVQEVYATMLGSAELALAAKGVPNPLAAAKERLVLYERLGRPLLGTGIQSRLFYCERADERERAVFEWIAGERGDLFYRRTGTVETQAFAAQFAPILRYWRQAGASQRLPRTPEELSEAALLANAREPEANFPADFWRVYDP